ncbi:hypothetical protein QBC43DRAFT_311458 [Cladorrhinum sp. PSN259]|nr:hypothetical protein QBC43DRAFT_311458 [Cladorrhinum sp. PSN259]
MELSVEGTVGIIAIVISIPSALAVIWKAFCNRHPKRDVMSQRENVRHSIDVEMGQMSDGPYCGCLVYTADFSLLQLLHRHYLRHRSMNERAQDTIFQVLVIQPLITTAVSPRLSDRVLPPPLTVPSPIYNYDSPVAIFTGERPRCICRPKTASH